MYLKCTTKKLVHINITENLNFMISGMFMRKQPNEQQEEDGGCNKSLGTAGSC